MNSTVAAEVENTKRFLNLADAQGSTLLRLATASRAPADIDAIVDHCESSYGYEVGKALRVGVGHFDELMSERAMMGCALLAHASLMRGDESEAVRFARLAEQAKARLDASRA